MKVKGTPWKPVCDEPRVEEQPKVVHLSPEEVSAGIPLHDPGLIKPNRLRLLKQDFLDHGFTEGCRGCRAILDGTEVKGHSEVCRKRMETKIQESEEGKLRKRKVFDRECEWMADKFQRGEDTAYPSASKPDTSGDQRPDPVQNLISSRPDPRQNPSSSSSSQPPKRKDEGDADTEVKRTKSVPSTGQKRTRDEDVPENSKKMSLEYLETCCYADLMQEIPDYKPLDIDLFYGADQISYIYDEPEWNLLSVSDMCEAEDFGNLRSRKARWVAGKAPRPGAAANSGVNAATKSVFCSTSSLELRPPKAF
jgi:hypothetical protein